VTAAQQRILVIGPSWVGDMVLSQVLYRYLHDTRPGVRIDVLAPAWSAPLLARMPEIHTAIDMPLDHGEVGLRTRRRIGRELAQVKYDQAIVLPNSFKSALVPFFAGITLRTGWRGEWRYGVLNDLRRLNETALPQMAQRFLALGLERGAALPEQIFPPVLHADAQHGEQVAREHGLDPQHSILALCPGAEFGPAKQWPPQYFAQLADAFAVRGWQVVLLGSERDKAICAEVEAAMRDSSQCRDLAARTSLAEAIDLLSLCRGAASNDSGLMHIAAALGIPQLALYGSTSPVFTPPLNPLAGLLREEIDCSPCFKRECPLGHHRCMQDLLPGPAITTLESLIREAGGKK
jgi:heptosyltransferase-2